MRTLKFEIDHDAFMRLLTLVGVALLLVTLMSLPLDAMAADSGNSATDGGLPFDSWLTKVRNSMTGPVAYTLSIVGIIVAGGILIFGGDLNGFFRSLIFLVLVMALLLGANTLIQSITGRGAEVASVTPAAPQVHAAVMRLEA